MALLLLILSLALSDAQAIAKAKSLWGPRARIGQARNPTDTYWTKMVGIDTTGCAQAFHVMGQAPNTWDAAFAAVPDTAIAGPYSGTITLNAQAWDNVAVVEMQFRLDGNALPVIIYDPAPSWGVAQGWNSASVPDGVHHLCFTARDAAGNVARSNVFVFRTQQNAPSIAPKIEFSNGIAVPIAE